MKSVATFGFIIRLLVLGTMVAAATGCASLTDEDPNMTPVPHSQPASWEGQVPGFNNMGR